MEQVDNEVVNAATSRQASTSREVAEPPSRAASSTSQSEVKEDSVTNSIADMQAGDAMEVDAEVKVDRTLATPKTPEATDAEMEVEHEEIAQGMTAEETVEETINEVAEEQ